MFELTLFERIGGEAVIEPIAQVFYERVLEDRRLAPFFLHLEMAHQLDTLRSFLVMAFGGPNRYAGRGMREAHAEAVEQGLMDHHFDCVVEHLVDALRAQSVADVDVEGVLKLMTTIRADVLGR